MPTQAPTESALKAYAEKLPKIYKDILAAFPDIEPHRREGYGIAVQTLAMHFVNRHAEHRFGDVLEACRRLAEKGFATIRHEVFVHPTDLGERLIAAVSGKGVPAVAFPELPQPSW